MARHGLESMLVFKDHIVKLHGVLCLPGKRQEEKEEEDCCRNKEAD